MTEFSWEQAIGQRVHAAMASPEMERYFAVKKLAQTIRCHCGPPIYTSQS